MRMEVPHHREEFGTDTGRDDIGLFQRNGDGYFSTWLDTPTALNYGKTLELARANAAEEIEAWQENRAESGN